MGGISAAEIRDLTFKLRPPTSDLTLVILQTQCIVTTCHVTA